MKKVAVCILVDGMYYQTRYVIENLLSKTKVPIKLYIYDFKQPYKDNFKMRDYFYELSQKIHPNVQYFFKQNEDHFSLSSIKNRILKSVAEELVCMFPSNYIVAENWLEELYYNLNNFPEAGIIGIRSGNEKCKLIPILRSDDTMEPVWFDPNNFVEGIQFFWNKLAGHENRYNEDPELAAFADMDFSFKAVQMGCKNFYIKNQWAVRIPIETNSLFPKKTPDAAAKFKAMVDEQINKDLKTAY